ncbi:MAG: type II toxin-antitoxin system prevent-host-death family antitoxin [Acidobacteria bacterium]|nr:MAG: type II toxin-antitoxin system prevent-host-death family antitoxin [Acidobacteriota bacterium]
MSILSAAEANRNFSKVLREVRDGHTYVVTSHGKPVAKIVPFDADSPARAAAKQVLMDRLQMQHGSRPIGRWTRDELYKD